MKQRRAFNSLPTFLRTTQNDREYYITDDVMFEPENASFLNGFIGDTTNVDSTDLERTPLITESNVYNQKYQLSIGTSYVDPDSDAYVSAAFYTDLVNQIKSNGGIVDDETRLFDCNYYAWTPPIDYDKFINFSRYFWTGNGAAELNGEYITKEPAGTQIFVHKFDGTNFVKIPVKIVNGLPSSGSEGDVIEDSSTTNRILYERASGAWNVINIISVEDIPTDVSTYTTGDYLYVCRTGENFNRPVVWKYSEDAGRWLSIPVVISKNEPGEPVEGMIWENANVEPYRRFNIYRGGVWELLLYTSANGPSGVPTSEVFIYDIRSLSEVDPWSAKNFWRYYDDLSTVDKSFTVPEDQGTRPILEFWGNLESYPGDTRNHRNDFPKFGLYHLKRHDCSGERIEAIPTDSYSGSTIIQYAETTSLRDDIVLGFPVGYNDSGEIKFTVTLETDEIPNSKGYRFFRDTSTNLIHLIWAKSATRLKQEKDENGLYSIPRNLSANPNHEILKEFSRSDTVTHFSSVIGSQDNFEGQLFGKNSYRLSKKNPTVGAELIDSEQSLLKAMSLLQNKQLDLPDAIRYMGKEYNKTIKKFINKLNQHFNNLKLCDPTGTLLITSSEAVDVILTEIFIGRNEDFPFYYSDMGTFTETAFDDGVVTILDSEPKPIYLPPSGPRVGSSDIFRPEKYLDRKGNYKLRGHEGIVLDSWGDDRDEVWLEFQTRLFDSVPDLLKVESETYTRRYNVSLFNIKDWYGNYVPDTDLSVDKIVENHTTETPSHNLKVFSKGYGVFATWDGYKWLTTEALVDDVFFNEFDEQYYIFNGIGTVLINRYPLPYQFSYTKNEFNRIIYREFDRWNVDQEFLLMDNTEFDKNDPFTWNYSSVGLEGNYRGIYSRVYNTVMPHSHPWEIAGYTIEPTWWRSEYIPDSIAVDGTPRYKNTHSMWYDLQHGINPITNKVTDIHLLIAPIPVDSEGELLDPISLGIVDSNLLDMNRIDEGWRFGDGSEVEQMFYNSPYWQYVQSLAGYLMKPAIWVETLWTQVFIAIGEKCVNKIWRAPHIVNENSLTRIYSDNNDLHLEIVNGEIVTSIGANAWVAERLKINGVDTQDNFVKVINNTIPALCWKTYGFVNDKRTTIKTISGINIPFEDVHVVLHEALPKDIYFCSGVMVIPDGTGYRVFGYDTTNPRFRIEQNSMPIVGGQIELRQSFIATENQHEYNITDFTLPRKSNTDTAVASVIINGLRIKPNFVTTDKNVVYIDQALKIKGGEEVVVSVVTTQSNPSTRMKSFKIDGIDFPYFAVGNGTFIDIDYGHYFDSPFEVINFMIGYGRYLNSQGWKFDEYENNNITDWLTGAKLFATWLIDKQKKRTNEETFFYSPLNKKAIFEKAHGHILNLEMLQFGSYGIIDKNGSPMDNSKTTISKIGETITVDSTEEMYGVRLFVTDIQHVVFLSPRTRFNDLIYDPILNLYHKVLVVNSYRSNNWNGRLEADGFIINNNEILPNFEKQAFDITRFYDKDNPPDNTSFRDQSLNLIGWYPNNYTTNISNRGMVNYYRGMIHAKGTQRPIHAYANSTKTGRSNVRVYEDWAWKIQEYGDTRISTMRFNVNKIDFRNDIQVIKFSGPVTVDDKIIEIPDFDRTNLNDNPRWIVPPSGDDVNIRFELNIDGSINSDSKIYVKLFNDDERELLNHFHFDPSLNKFEPEALSQLDFISYFDPARYNNGSGKEYSNSQVWGKKQVGNFWWRLVRRQYSDYKSVLPDYLTASREWGKLLYFRASLIRNDDVVTVTTLDPFTKLPVSHNLSNNDIINIEGSKVNDYNGEFVVTVVSDTEFNYPVTTIPDEPYGDIKVIVGEIEIFEWVESEVTPDQWESYVSTLDNTNRPSEYALYAFDEQPSYVNEEVLDENGNPKTVYYFWIRNNSLTNPYKNYTGFEVQQRLKSPTNNGIAWFAAMDDKHALVYTNGELVKDDYSLEFSIDNRSLDTYVEWVLLSKDDSFTPVPKIILDKILDSLYGYDEFGKVVPSELLANSEQQGNGAFPAQTIFPNRPKAREVFVKTVNDLFKTINFSSLVEEDIFGFFTLDNETATNISGFWTRTMFIDPSITDFSIFETVPSITERNRRASLKRYADGDIILVKSSDNVDPWNGAVVSTAYSYNDGVFTEIAVERSAIQINENIFNENFRELFTMLYNYMGEPLTKNNFVFTMLYEMLIQNPMCDWFFQTSFISAYIRRNTSSSLFVQPNENEEIINNILDIKPYRTKIRNQTFSYRIENEEDFSAKIMEMPVFKLTVVFDRVNCHLLEDRTWGTSSWGEEIWGKSLWKYNDIGRNDWIEVSRVNGNVIDTTYEFETSFDPSLYAQRIIVLNNGNVVNLEDYGLTYTMLKDHTKIYVTFNTTLSPAFTLIMEQTQGFYEGSNPSLSDDFKPYVSNYFHHTARTIRPYGGEYLPCSEMSGCDCSDTTVESPEERISSDMTERVTIVVKNDWTAAYRGWGATPWGSTPWGEGPEDVGRRVFIQTIGEETSIEPNTVSFPTHETVVTSTHNYIVGSRPLDNIVQVYRSNGGSYILQTENVHYRFVDSFKHVIEFLTPETYSYISDGISTTFNATNATNGINKVSVNGELLTEGVNYTISGTTINFTQPPVSVIELLGTTVGNYAVGDDESISFDMKQSPLNEENVFLFKQNELVKPHLYTLNDNLLEMSTAPVLDDKLIIFSFANNDNYNRILFDRYAFSGDGTTTTYPINQSVTNERVFVFVDFVYQVEGVDYVTVNSGPLTEIEFTSPPSMSTDIEFRIMNQYLIATVSQTILDASGTNIDDTGLYGLDPNNMMVFVNNEIQNCYSVFSSPDFVLIGGIGTSKIQWTNVPSSGDKISIRYFTKTVFNTENHINVFPPDNANVSIVPNGYIDPGDNIRLIYNGWFVGELGSFYVDSVPNNGSYSIENQFLTLTNTPSINQNIVLTYIKDRPSYNKRSLLVRMSNIANTIINDHTVLELSSNDINFVAINTVTKRKYVWDGTSWIDNGLYPINDKIFIKDTNEIWVYDGVGFNKVFETGDSYLTPPVLSYPLNGEGISSGTYALGQTLDANIHYPAAYQIMQHPGDW